MQVTLAYLILLMWRPAASDAVERPNRYRHALLLATSSIHPSPLGGVEIGDADKTTVCIEQ